MTKNRNSSLEFQAQAFTLQKLVEILQAFKKKHNSEVVFGFFFFVGHVYG